MFVFWAILAFTLAVFITPVVKRLAWRLGCVDVPRPPRNLHRQSVAKLGGLAVYLAFAITVLVYWQAGFLDTAIIPVKFLWGLLFGGAVLMLGGYLDDKYDLPAKWLWVFPVLASLIALAVGIGSSVSQLTNPFGAPINLHHAILGMPLSAAFVIIWLNGMMFTTKFLDGLDGLVAGVGTIAGFTLFALSLTEKVNQPITASLSIIFAGALLGYLVYAKYPAKIFLGEGGSTLVGFILGVLSIILGGKVATALLVMGVPILDVALVIVQRLWQGKSPFVGDRLHLHFRLIDLGYSQKQVVFGMYSISALFGSAAVFLQAKGKLIALILLVAVMVGIVFFWFYGMKRRQPAVD